MPRSQGVAEDFRRSPWPFGLPAIYDIPGRAGEGSQTLYIVPQQLGA
jgi:hypothetical protein